MKKTLITIITAVLLVGCSGSEKHVAGKLAPQSTLKSVEVFYVASNDLGWEKKAFVLNISNQSSRKLENCMVTIDEEYQAPLSHMIYYYDSLKGGAPYGKRDLPAGYKEKFVFSHDISGHGVFTNSLGKRWPEGSRPQKIAIKCDQGSGEWLFSNSSP